MTGSPLRDGAHTLFRVMPAGAPASQLVQGPRAAGTAGDVTGTNSEEPMSDNLPTPLPLTWTDTPLRDRSQGLTLAESKAVMLADEPSNPLVPAITATLLVTLFFGVFGAIPASIHADRARQQGASAAKYWVCFAAVMVINLLALVIVLF